MKLLASQIMEFRRAADKIMDDFDRRVKASPPQSEERKVLGELQSAVSQIDWMAQQLLTAEITIKG